jgi:AcrR family transcriptional regulator
MMTTPGRATPTSTRERVLDAAEELVLRDGITALTLERAAREAGLSKGGVLYHFPSRNTMISAMVRRLVDQLESGLPERRRGVGPGSLTRAYIADCFESGPDELRQRTDRLGAALLAEASAEPDLLEPLREVFASWQEQIVDDGLDPALATVIRLAADGLWLTEMFGLSGLDPQLREQVRATLERLSQAGDR